MPNLSPICTVNGVAPPVDVAASSTITVALVTPAGVGAWSITCTSTDELGSTSTTNATTSVNMAAKTATFQVPATLGSKLIFTSTVGVSSLGRDGNGILQPTYTTTFAVNVATNEGTEQSPFGWISEVNDFIRAAAAAGITAGAVAGAGLWHSTAGTLDGSAYKGTADQFLVTNHAASDTSWITLGGDATYASGSLKVVALQGNAVATTAPTTGQTLTWNGSAWAPATPSSGSSGALTAFGADLAGSAATTQWVAAISGSGGVGGTVPLHVSSLQFDAAQATATLSQAQSTTGAGATMSFVSQAAKSTSGNAGGNLQLVTGAGDGAGAPGTLVGKVAATQVLGLGAASTDFLRFGGTPASTGFLRASNNASITVARDSTNSVDLVLVATDGSNDMLFGSSAQGATTFLQSPASGGVKLTVGAATSLSATTSFTNLLVNGSSYLNLTSSQIQPQVQSIAWAAGVATPTITQAQATGNVPASSIVLAPQLPSTTASGINLNGTHVIVALPGSSTKAGTFRVTQNGNVVASIGPNGLVQGTTFQSLWLGATVASESATNFALASDGATSTVMNGPSSIQLQVANTTWLTVTSSQVTVGTNTLAFTAAATSPSFGQLAAASNVAPSNLTISPQAPFGSATGSNRNGTSLIVALPAATNSGTVAGSFRITQAGTGILSTGPNGLVQGSGFAAVWIGATVGSESAVNYAIVSDGASVTQLNGPTAAVLAVANAALLVAAASGVQVGPTTSFGSGVGVFGITNATTDPTTNPSGGGVLYESSTDLALLHRGSTSAVYALAGTGSGSRSTQTCKRLRQMFFGSSSSSAPITIATIAIPTNTAVYIEADIVVRDSVTISNSIGGKTTCIAYNSGGTVTIKSNTALVGGIPTFSASGANVVVSSTAPNGNSCAHQAEIYWLIN